MKSLENSRLFSIFGGEEKRKETTVGQDPI
jgi:hypothetical protein